MGEVYINQTNGPDRITTAFDQAEDVHPGAHKAVLQLVRLAGRPSYTPTPCGEAKRSHTGNGYCTCKLDVRQRSETPFVPSRDMRSHRFINAPAFVLKAPNSLTGSTAFAGIRRSTWTIATSPASRSVAE